MSTLAQFLVNSLPPPAQCFAILIGILELLPFGIIGLYHPNAFADGYGLPISIARQPDSELKLGRTKQAPADSDSGSTFPEKASSEEKDHETKRALVAAIAARNVQNGILLLTFGLVLKDRTTLGVIVLTGLVSTLADTIIVRSYGRRDKSIGHYIGIFNSLAIGGTLLLL